MHRYKDQKLQKSVEERIEKVKKLRALDINPYPAEEVKKTDIKIFLDSFDDAVRKKQSFTLAGRIMVIRSHGKSAFFDLRDETGRVQCFVRFDNIGEEKFTFFEDFIDTGDIVKVSGQAFETKSKEPTVLLTDIQLLTKALRPVPAKWKGIEDIELKYRKRYIDLIVDENQRRVFDVRSKVISLLRKYLHDEGFVEVETPVLHVIPGGTSARPFITHHNALDHDFYLRIALELHQKRLMVGGFEKTFEIGRVFRNEGIDREHNPEFTMMEFYWAYKDYNATMEFTEKLLSRIVKDIHSSYKVPYQGKELDFTPPWKREKFGDLFEKKFAINILKEKSEEKLRKIAKDHDIELDKSFGFTKIIDEMYKEKIRKKIAGPVFVIDHPIELEPLAKANKDGLTVQRYQPVVCGFELLKAYSELNDPMEQYERFCEQEKMRERGDDEAQYIDEDYIEALEYGMPPTSGWGMGIDRFVAILTDSPNLKDVIYFPTLKPKAV